ncbi:GIY-YIG nuclease family protein [Rheinheimera riviphila]|uniref:GIY-YIG nuclease family protein n=1 Tax=Rheinheimera riviphila TaxID=1834037 RepID=A0A437QM40_9GAMM|nr:GIY-YIG nuclease family protein [Rheinheimera riviphila]RVU35552.1 GIY-YIG nuclease family protein [Rheinheimera riviphila]
MTDYVSFYDLAKRLGVSYDTVRRTISKFGDQLGTTVKKLKIQGSKGALTQCVAEEEANTFVAFFENKSKSEEIGGGEENEFSFRRFGYFYIIQVIPELMPNRVKIGFTDNLDQRLREHQTSAPTAKFVKYWECKRSWDQAVMDSITRENCSLVMNEVYEGDVASFIQRADAFFSMMPNSSTEIPLAESSPLRQEPDSGHDQG